MFNSPGDLDHICPERSTFLLTKSSTKFRAASVVPTTGCVNDFSHLLQATRSDDKLTLNLPQISGRNLHDNIDLKDFLTKTEPQTEESISEEFSPHQDDLPDYDRSKRKRQK
jgi:hypothetical protein